MVEPQHLWRNAEVVQISLPIVEALTTAVGSTKTRPLVLVRLTRDGGDGRGECVALPDASYDGESSDASFEQLCSFFAGQAEKNALDRPSAFALNMAETDLRLRLSGQSLATEVASVNAVVPCAVVGLGSSEVTVSRVERQLAAGYRNFKLKVTPNALDVVRVVRERFPELLLKLDANGSFDWSNTEHRATLEQMGAMGVESIEQPFAVGCESDTFHLPTLGLQPWLDESVSDFGTTERLIDSGFDRLVIKPYRFRTHSAVIELTNNYPEVMFSIGGMIDGGLSRSVNLALAATAPFSGQSAEVAADGRWFKRNYVKGGVEIDNGTIAVPMGPGIGAVVDRSSVDDLTIRAQSYKY